MAFGPVAGRGAKVGMQGQGAAGANPTHEELAELDLDLHLELALPPAAEPETAAGDGSASTPSSPPSDGGASFRSSSDSASPRNAEDRREDSLSETRQARFRCLAPAASDPAGCLRSQERAPHPSSPLLIARPSVAVRKYTEPLDRRHSVCRAALIRANACRFADRYDISAEPTLVGQGTFGRVYECVDKLADIKRAVKRLRLPAGALEQRQLVNEVDALIALDHPAIVRLIEYFVADAEASRSSPKFAAAKKRSQRGKFSEAFAVRIQDSWAPWFLVPRENFRFETSRADAALRMVDFGLSEMSAEESAANADGAATAQAQAGAEARHLECIWAARKTTLTTSSILQCRLCFRFAALSHHEGACAPLCISVLHAAFATRLHTTASPHLAIGEELWLEVPSGGLPEATNPSYVDLLRVKSSEEQRRDAEQTEGRSGFRCALGALTGAFPAKGAEQRARDLLAKMLEPSTDRRIAAQEAKGSVTVQAG
ncbi:CPK2 [Symbiodinium sp. CCMP2592]|nr:CPK2 [Symbiodinium sp. CCMP2592]